MALPVLQVSKFRTIPVAEVPAGRVVGVERRREWQLGVTVGAASASHVLMNDHANLPRAVDLSSLRMVRVLDLGPADDLLLDIQKNAVDAREFETFIGCMGVTGRGLVLCAAGESGSMSQWTPSYFGVDGGWTPLNDMRAVAEQGLWFTQWALSFRDANEVPVRILGNPDWKAWQRDER